MDAFQKYEEWLTSPVFDEATKEELRSIAGNETEIRDRFTDELEFGTAGLRGVIGAGTFRMNMYTVRRATQGLANYILKQGTQDKGVAISFDCRRMSPEFADAAALCLCANGIPVHIFPVLHATPILSFAVRYFGCTAGINITASHNPPEYNGYKVYWDDGGQIVAPHDKGIIDEVYAIRDFGEAKTMDKEAAIAAGLYQVIGPEVDDAFLAAVKKVIKHPEALEAEAKNIRIVYTPLYGCGNVPVRRVLAELGFEQVYVVPEQELPDGNFPTVEYPNPEDPKAFTLALALAKKVDADLILATDPDADRLGVWVKTAVGEYMPLTGNQSGCLLADYEISGRKETGGLTENSTFISTIVTSNLAGAVARKHGVNFYEVLTGFKNIAALMRKLENESRLDFLFGFEESYGCMIGDHCRDKDSVVACTALGEAAAYYKTKGKTLYDALMDLYAEVGYYKDLIFTKSFKGLGAKQRMAAVMDGLRANPPAEMCGLKVIEFRDYKKDIRRDIKTGEVTSTGLPASDVLYFALEGDAWFCVRPSGTEPKIKLYSGVVGTDLKDAEEKAARMNGELAALMESFG